MEYYYESILSQTTNDESIDEEPINNEGINNSDEEPINNDNDDNLITGGKSTKNILIYSFVDIYNQLKGKVNDLINLKDEIIKIIQDIHKQLPNQYVSSNSIAEQIIKEIDKYIISNISKSNKFYLPVISQLCSFNIETYFEKLNNVNKILFINSNQQLICQQIQQNYNDNPYRLELNQFINYIIKHYQQSSSDKSHSIKYSKQVFKQMFENIKSAFIDEDDFNSLLETLDHSLITSNNSNDNHLFILHKLVESSQQCQIETIDLNDISSDINTIISCINGNNQLVNPKRPKRSK